MVRDFERNASDDVCSRKADPTAKITAYRPTRADRAKEQALQQQWLRMPTNDADQVEDVSYFFVEGFISTAAMQNIRF